MAADEYILIAEDSAPNRKILQVILESQGYSVLAYEDGEQAWEGLEAEKDKNIVAVYSDIMMPNMSGIDLLKKVRESDSHKALPFSLVTAVPDKDYLIQAKELGVQGFIVKPIDTKKLVAHLDKLFPERQKSVKAAA